MEKMGPDGPKWGQEDFFLLIQTKPTFWATRILNLRFFSVVVFFGIPIFQISRSQISKFPEIWLGPSLGPAWTQLGPDWPAFMHAGLGLAPPDKLSDPKYIVKNQLDPSPIHATHPCMQGSNTSQ